MSDDDAPFHTPRGRAAVDPALAFGISLALSLVLWWPTLQGTLSGNIDITVAGLRYLAALGISWAGVFAIATVFATYGQQSQAAAPPTPSLPPPAVEHPLRRVNDAAALEAGADDPAVAEPPAA
jgi:hypothetical protein